MNSLCKTCAVGALALLAISATSARADLVYANTTNDLSVRFNPGLFEVGDEIVLGGVGRTVTNFAFQYWGLSFSGDEQARLRFYLNDGPLGDSGYATPGTLFYDSGLFNIGATPRATLNFDLDALTTDALLGLSGDVPNSFTWSVQFQGITGGESAGLDLYGTTSDTFLAGYSYQDYWDNTGSGWELRTNNTTPINFAAQIEAVPEPASMTLGVVGGLSLLALRRRMNRK